MIDKQIVFNGSIQIKWPDGTDPQVRALILEQFDYSLRSAMNFGALNVVVEFDKSGETAGKLAQ